MKLFSCTGGGVRGIAVAGVLQQGAQQGRWDSDRFDIITGDSFGALIAALVANQWTPQEMGDLFVKTDFKQLLTTMPWQVRKPLLAVSPISLHRIKALIDNLQLKSSPKLFINTWDAESNQQVIYCEQKPAWAEKTPGIPTVWIENAYTDLGFGTVITRSMALPGLEADHRQWMDGGLSEHPPLAFVPRTVEAFIINLGYAGLVPHNGNTIPKTLLDRALYAYEVTASTRQRMVLSQFTQCIEINPLIYDVDSIDFSLTAAQKQALIDRGSEATKAQWAKYIPSSPVLAPEAPRFVPPENIG